MINLKILKLSKLSPASRLQSLMFRSVLVNERETIKFEYFRPGCIPDDKLRELKQFRFEQYEKSNSYLNTSDVRKLERDGKFDERSWIFTARCRETKRLIGTMRITPHPFEFSFSMPETSQIKFKQGYFEINRLVADNRHKDLGKKLIVYGSILLKRKTDVRGFVAICRKEKVGMFRKCGVQRIGETIYSESRDGEYQVIKINMKWGTYLFSGSFLKRFFSFRKNYKQLLYTFSFQIIIIAAIFFIVNK